MVHKHEKGSGSVAKRLLGLCLALVMLCGVFVPTFASVAGVDDQTTGTEQTAEPTGGTDGKQDTEGQPTGGTDEKQTTEGQQTGDTENNGDAENVSKDDGDADVATGGEGDANATDDANTNGDGEADNTAADANAKYREMYDAIMACEDAEQLAELLTAAEEDEGFTAWLKTLSEEELAAFNEKTTPTATYATEVTSVRIADSVKTDGRFTAEVYANGTKCDIATLVEEGYTITWKKVSADGKTTTDPVVCKKVSSSYYNMAGNGEWVNVAFDNGAQCTYTVTVSKGTTTKTATLKVDYYDEIQNGSFENPVNDEYQKQYTVGTTGLFWKTTGVGKGSDAGKDVEIVSTKTKAWSDLSLKWHGIAKAAAGDQYAEINAEEEGSLYQDVLTKPGTTMYWQLAHNARVRNDNEYYRDDYYNYKYDIMYVIIMDTTTASQLVTGTEAQKNLKAIAPQLEEGYTGSRTSQAQQLYNAGARSYKCSSNKYNEWLAKNGSYLVPDGQYLTRYFFVSYESASNKKAVGNQIDQVTFSTKVPDPIFNSGMILVQKRIYGLTLDEVQANLKEDFITCDGTYVTLTNWETKTNDNNEVEYIFANYVKTTSDIDGTVTYTFAEETERAQVAGYQLTIAPESKTQTVTLGGGTKQKTIVFTNTYTPANTTVTVSKQVTGLLGDTSKEFNFTWSYTKDNVTTKGKDFKLSNGGEQKLENIPIGATVTVMETNADGYTTTWVTGLNGSGDTTTATLVAGSETSKNTITFTNNKDTTPDTGVFLDSMPYIMALVIVAGGAAVFFLRRRKKSED